MTIIETAKEMSKFFPLDTDDSIDFREWFHNLINSFTKLVDETDFDFMESNSSNDNIVFCKMSAEEYKMEFKAFVKSIEDTLHNYLMGSPSSAFDKLNKQFQHLIDTKLIVCLKGVLMADNSHYPFYRLRTREQKSSLERKDLFHVPFSIRRKVSSKRYSIPGLPSLYLSNSVYVAWEELGRPPLEQIHASRFELAKRFHYLDMTNQYYYNLKHLSSLQNEEQNESLLRSIFRLPLVLACSARVESKEDHFKPEYIIPQLLMEWIKVHTEYQGIKYTSTNVDLDKANNIGNFANYAIPIVNQYGDYCPTLKGMFRMTEPISAYLTNLDENFINNGPIQRAEPVRIEVDTIELFNKRSSQYRHTKFYRIEEILINVPATQIDF